VPLPGPHIAHYGAAPASVAPTTSLLLMHNLAKGAARQASRLGAKPALVAGPSAGPPPRRWGSRATRVLSGDRERPL